MIYIVVENVNIIEQGFFCQAIYYYIRFSFLMRKNINDGPVILSRIFLSLPFLCLVLSSTRAQKKNTRSPPTRTYIFLNRNKI
jgi:hypothetical protein